MIKSKAYPFEKAINPKTGLVVTREEWEKDHIPTCNHYPCDQWPTIHWHINLPNQKDKGIKYD